MCNVQLLVGRFSIHGCRAGECAGAPVQPVSAHATRAAAAGKGAGTAAAAAEGLSGGCRCRRAWVGPVTTCDVSGCRQLVQPGWRVGRQSVCAAAPVEGDYTEGEMLHCTSLGKYAQTVNDHKLDN
jgi:hypothetical protein